MNETFPVEIRFWWHRHLAVEKSFNTGWKPIPPKSLKTGRAEYESFALSRRLYLDYRAFRDTVQDFCSDQKTQGQSERIAGKIANRYTQLLAGNP